MAKGCSYTDAEGEGPVEVDLASIVSLAACGASSNPCVESAVLGVAHEWFLDICNQICLLEEGPRFQVLPAKVRRGVLGAPPVFACICPLCAKARTPKEQAPPPVPASRA